MAMIECPHCGEAISDKARKCIHCGLVLVEEPKKVCAECGVELEEGATECNKCGCPVEVEHTPDAEPVREPTAAKVSQGWLAVMFVIAVVLIGALFLGGRIQQQNGLKEAEQTSAEYAENLEEITYTMLSGAAEAETCGNLIKSVWYNTIYEEYDASTDQYTLRGNGLGFHDDFNDSLRALFNDQSFKRDISSVEENQETVAELMKNMKNPPEEWEDAYEDLKDYYDAYLSLTNLAIDPSGSLTTFSSNFATADTTVTNCYSKMKLYFD